MKTRNVIDLLTMIAIRAIQLSLFIICIILFIENYAYLDFEYFFIYICLLISAELTLNNEYDKLANNIKEREKNNEN